ncbi:MAG: hypothetical protein QME07_02770 [bacterium]|nr:hypothetical protein [bacterium]
MLLGADTGFLIALANKNKMALDVWQSIKEKENEMVISTISMNCWCIFISVESL